MSNLFSALGWLLVDVTTRPDLAAAIRDGDHALAERCALESTRIAQRSIMLRAVLRPIHIDDGTRTWSLEPGVTLATLLPLTNLYELLPQFTDASPRLAQIGGVARASRACPIKFSGRTSDQAGTQLP